MTVQWWPAWPTSQNGTRTDSRSPKAQPRPQPLRAPWAPAAWAAAGFAFVCVTACLHGNQGRGPVRPPRVARTKVGAAAFIPARFGVPISI